MNYFESKVRFEKTLENGKTKKVTEPYLFDAVSFTEAEARTIEELTPFISGSFTITNINRASYSETILDDCGDFFYKCRLSFITMDETGRNEKKTATNWLVQAHTLQEAKDKVVARMGGTTSDYTIIKVEETAIVDVYPHKEKESK